MSWHRFWIFFFKSYRGSGQNFSFELPLAWNIILRDLCLKGSLLLFNHLNAGQWPQDLCLTLCEKFTVLINQPVKTNLCKGNV